MIFPFNRLFKGGQKGISQPRDRGGWRSVLESYPGAWQQSVEVHRDNVLAFSTVYACISRISSDVAKLRPILRQQGKDGVWTERDLPRITSILKRPNHFQNRIQFLQSWLISKLSHGNTYILKQRGRNRSVDALYVLDPRLVRVLVSDDGQVFYECQSDNVSGITTTVTVPASEIIHDRMNTLHHPLIGLSPIFACGLSATQGIAIQNSSASFFAKGARPGGVLSAPGEIKKETAERLSEYWNKNFSGADAGRVAVLGDGLKYEPMMMKSTDAQLVEQLRLSAETVANTFGVPAFMVGAGPVPASANVQSLTMLYYTQSLQMHIESVEALLDEGLGLPARYGIEFDLDALLRMDTLTLVQSMSEGVKSGILAPDEARRRLGYGVTEGGATPYLQQQNYSLAALARRDAQDDPFNPAENDPIDPPVDEKAIVKAFAAALNRDGQ